MTEVAEKDRLANLYQYEILDTPADGTYDEVTSLASKVFDVPIAIVSLVDKDRIWFKSAHGLDVDEIPREPGLCSSAILSDDIYLVENAKNDPRTLTNPLVTGALGLQFYAAAPLISKARHRLGTFCIIDSQPRKLSGKESSMLIHFARIVMDHFEVKLQAREMIHQVEQSQLQK